MRILALIAVTLLCALTARADKIVLKNGRQIVAYNVAEVGDKVQYETSAGQLSIPKSLVDHIERGGLVPLTESPAAAAANLKVTPPAVESLANAGEIDHAAVHDGFVDREYIGRLENEARGGGAQANLKVALAHHAASQFELARGDLEHALTEERAAVTYQPEQPALLMNLAYLYLRKSEFKNALDYLDRAKRMAPGDADVYKLEGWAYYGMNRLGPATEEWKKSLALRPDADTQAALEKALRDKAEEESYKENESAHFQLKYNGEAEPALAREVLRTLEGHFTEIESALNYTPPEPIGVVLYTQESYADITQAPRWVGAINDGRIRVPVQGLTSVTWDLSRVLKHELTHSFIQQKTRGRAPTWMQEGVAQWMEGKRSDESAAVLVQVHNDGQAAGLGQLEGSWMRLQDDIARYAYAWALANVEYIVETQGMSDVERILDRIAAGTSTEQALREVLHDDYGDLMASTVGYLKKNYVR
jgi:tetratricopeptide (TPR) repeat protein